MSSESTKPQSGAAARPANSPSRRSVLRASAVAASAAAIGFPYVITANVRGANDKIRIAGVGVGGKGASDLDQAASAGGEVVAVCDVDSNQTAAKLKKYPSAKAYKDFRKMFEEMSKDIDAVVVSTPDHLHGVICGAAMKLGKAVYCQKPLTQTVYEARALKQLAKEKKVATQMGNQGSALPGLRRAVECVHAGLIGNVKEIHVWSNRPIWPQGMGAPTKQEEVPAHLDWDLWLGPRANRPYSSAYAPFKWRGWRDFGTGALGDMACHTVNMPFRAAKLGYPNVIELEEASQIFPESFPKTSRIRFEFPEREGLPALKFWWYDGSPKDKGTPALRPPAELTKEIVEMKGLLPESGALLIGEKGKIFSDDDYGARFYVMLNEDKKYMGSGNHAATKAIPENYTKPPAGSNDQ
ncbi:MAG TPA: Gfo/Idh/MocA family oxidoreductase, partial [Tepidisphaeraceae bacterium]|nr:Gfo/Idh/MocA family oxidoreductase [Tepidisphaeraceae bacterium]